MKLDINKFNKAKKILEEKKREFSEELRRLKTDMQEYCNHPKLSKFEADEVERMDVNYPISYTCLKCGKNWGCYEDDPKLEPKVTEHSY